MNRFKPHSPLPIVLCALLLLAFPAFAQTKEKVEIKRPPIAVVTTQSRTMPDLFGKDLAIAEAILKKMFPNLIIQANSVNDQRVEPGQVARQLPATGQPLTAQTQVILYYRPSEQRPPSNDDGLIRVPPLVGKTLSEARALLHFIGLNIGLPQGATDNNLTVIGQSPEAGTRLRPNDRVNVELSRQSQGGGNNDGLVSVPPLVGSTVSEARQRLRGIRLNLGLPPSSGNVENSSVASQSPASGQRVRPSTTVNVQLRSRNMPVPLVTGLLRDQAENRIRAVGLVVGEVTSSLSPKRNDEVLSQSPPAGRPATVGSAVNLIVSQQTVLVPDVRNLSVDQARSRLAAFGLKVGDTPTRISKGNPGIVLDQSPLPDIQVPINSAVALTISVQPPKATVPNLHGQHHKTAEQTLSKVQLRLGKVTEQQSDSTPDTVIAQTPDAGATVFVDSAVDVVIAVPIKATVPDVRNKLLAAARIEIESASLRAGTVTSEKSTALPDVVLRQSLAPGRSVNAGSRIDLVVAAAPTQASVTPTPPSGVNPPSPPFTDGFKVLGVALIGLAGFLLAKIFKRLRNKPSAKLPPPKPRLNFRARPDAGRQSIRTVSQPRQSFTLSLRPRADAGTQRINYHGHDGNLIAAEREEL